MNNEILLVLSLIFVFATILVMYRFFGKYGLYAMAAILPIIANIEVLILIYAFGLSQTLGNVLFGATFLISDILSENESKKDAKRAVYIGVVTLTFFVLISQTWMLYQPAPDDYMAESIAVVFENTPRIMFASIMVFFVSQYIDVILYHKWWAFTKKVMGDSSKGLWIRNTGSTMISQLINSFLFNFIAFYGVFEWHILISISISTYLLYLVIAMLDIPAAYIARRIKRRGHNTNL